MPSTAIIAGFATTVGTKYVSVVSFTTATATTGTITVASSTAAIGGGVAASQSVRLAGTGIAGQAVDWDCQPTAGATGIQTKFLPADCRL